ncbi:probable palmitoyltransferase ZDHHC24 [Drosophila miranda]|uniref:probable palmitoyltransferase ZDHHC24 n=1 Tax=Drosophila miranda TaxID=7229 RepID=UPI0007E61416|nr:probable palmitoyltransferase ZDHHC24 [Drosophila miranda]
MILRSWDHVRPRCFADLSCLLLLVVFIPVTYVFHMTLVLPELFGVGSFWYTVIWVAAQFLIFNITANLLACMLVDTTIRMELLKPPLDPDLRARWHMCNECQALVPPRSWHCEVCNVCVLKRDHHCRFTCCCIGHHNYRYFVYFLLYLMIGSFVAGILGGIYLWNVHFDFYYRPFTLITVFVPAVSLTLSPSWESFYLLTYLLTWLAFGISTSLLLVYHWPILKLGSVAKERRSRNYDLGMRANMEMIFGRRMYLTWLSPFVHSELPHDGINWEPVLTHLTKED